MAARVHSEFARPSTRRDGREGVLQTFTRDSLRVLQQRLRAPR